MGCMTGGKWLIGRDYNTRIVRPLLPVEQEFLDNTTADPVNFFATCSKDMDRCCYCNKPLEDERSKQVGYGKVCAARWGLPWGKDYDENVPSFAAVWGRSPAVREMMAAIRADPYEPTAWLVLGDALEECSCPKKPTAPEKSVLIPRA